MTDPNIQYSYAPQPPQPLTALGGGAKAAWFFIGFFMGLPGLLLAYATSRDQYSQVQSETVRFAVIGFLVSLAVVLLMSCVLPAVFATVMAGILSNLNYSY